MTTLYSPFSHPFAKPLGRAKDIPLIVLQPEPPIGPTADSLVETADSTTLTADSR